MRTVEYKGSYVLQPRMSIVIGLLALTSVQNTAKSTLVYEQDW